MLSNLELERVALILASKGKRLEPDRLVIDGFVANHVLTDEERELLTRYYMQVYGIQGNEKQA